MAYLDPLDPTTPTDANLVSSGDDEIRKLKRAIIERFSTIIEDLDADPLVLKAAVFPDPVPAITPGLVADRPNPPPTEFTQYYAYDSDQLFVARDSTVTPGTLEWIEAKQTQTSDPIVLAYSAGEARFAPEGSETRAARVSSAIAAARLGTSPIKVVYVPKSLWGYCGDVDFSTSMFDSTILLVREGAIPGWYDPVAYGADITGTVNSRAVIDICFLHASTSQFGMRLVAFTVAGEYLMSTDVDQRDCAILVGAGVTFTGGGELTGDYAFKIPPDPPAADPPIDAAFTYNADGGSPHAVVATVVKRLHLKFTGTANASGQITISLADAGFAGAYNLANLVTCVLTYRTSSGSQVSATIYSFNTGTNVITVDLDGGAQTITGDAYLTFSA